MPAVSIGWDDLAPFAEIPSAKAAAMIEDALAMAAMVAPCISSEDLTDSKAAAAKAIIRGAILRWHDSGSGAVSQQSAGPFQQTLDTRQPRRSLFWPSEIEQLEKLCRADDQGGAWGYDTLPSAGSIHSETCDLRLGGTHCSCGAVIAGYPLWEEP